MRNSWPDGRSPSRPSFETRRGKRGGGGGGLGFSWKGVGGLGFRGLGFFFPSQRVHDSGGVEGLFSAGRGL